MKSIEGRDIATVVIIIIYIYKSSFLMLTVVIISLWILLLCHLCG
jgi:hypothetical protein